MFPKWIFFPKYTEDTCMTIEEMLAYLFGQNINLWVSFFGCRTLYSPLFQTRNIEESYLQGSIVSYTLSKRRVKRQDGLLSIHDDFHRERYASDAQQRCHLGSLFSSILHFNNDQSQTSLMPDLIRAYSCSQFLATFIISQPSRPLVDSLAYSTSCPSP